MSGYFKIGNVYCHFVFDTSVFMCNIGVSAISMVCPCCISTSYITNSIQTERQSEQGSIRFIYAQNKEPKAMRHEGLYNKTVRIHKKQSKTQDKLIVNLSRHAYIHLPQEGPKQKKAILAINKPMRQHEAAMPV